MADNKDKVVFSDTKKVLTLGQFEALMALARTDYDNLAKAIKTRDGFEQKAKEQMSEQMGEMPANLAKKLVEGLVRKAYKEFLKIFSDELARHEDVLDFLNTFSTKENQLKNLK